MSVQLAIKVRVLFVLLLLPGCHWIGQRYLQVRIERERKPVLKTAYSVSDRLDGAAIWKSLQGKAFEPVGPLKLQSDSAKETVLTGQLRIVILHTDQTIATAQVDRVRLVRSAGAPGKWELPQEEVERTAQAAGL